MAVAAVAGIAATGAQRRGDRRGRRRSSFPNNVVVFPDRDFVTIEGYQTHIGRPHSSRSPAAARSSARPRASSRRATSPSRSTTPAVIAGAPARASTSRRTSVPGDKVNISFNGIDAGDTIAGNAFVTGDSTVSGNTLTVKGYAGPGVNQAQMEQRIINPDLVDTEIGKRDIRALPGPLTPAPKGGYSSSLEFEGNTFTATYVFTTAANAQIAANSDLGERAMSWQEEDADGNRQGLTIAEYGEAGGPGMGGCPLGPGDAGAPQPGAASVVRSPGQDVDDRELDPRRAGARRGSRHRLRRRGDPADPVRRRQQRRDRQADLRRRHRREPRRARPRRRATRSRSGRWRATR